MTKPAFHIIANAIVSTAELHVSKQMMPGECPDASIRGSLLYATISTEISSGTSREDLLRIVGLLYDVLAEPDLAQQN